MGEVIYLTGAPAAGKSSLSRELRKTIPSLQVFEYGDRLTRFVAERRGLDLTQVAVREQSARLITPADVADLDRILSEFIEKERTTSHVLIDSHAVTKEEYGFRITPFSLEDFAALRVTQIWVLYVPTDVAIARITANPEGRPLPSAFEAEFHTFLQATVAATYAIRVGIAVHYFDASKSLEELVKRLATRLRSSAQ